MPTMSYAEHPKPSSSTIPTHVPTTQSRKNAGTSMPPPKTPSTLNFVAVSHQALQLAHEDLLHATKHFIDHRRSSGIPGTHSFPVSLERQAIYETVDDLIDSP
jgi:hypothetical protein